MKYIYTVFIKANLIKKISVCDKQGYFKWGRIGEIDVFIQLEYVNLISQ